MRLEQRNEDDDRAQSTPPPLSDDEDDEPPELIELGNSHGQEDEESLQGKTAPNPVPLTILTGFLGSGKTTLIRHILSSPLHQYKIAVIENEFSPDGGIESLIAKDGLENSLEDFIELPNGCVCCSLRNSLVETLEMLLNKKPDLDYILLETSGMADPGPIAATFFFSQDSTPLYRIHLDGIVTIVDSKNCIKYLKETVELSKQIAFADRILLNKIDLVSSQEITVIQKLIAKMNPSVSLRETSFSKIMDLDFVLNVKSMDAALHGNDYDLPTSNKDSINHVHEGCNGIHCPHNKCPNSLNDAFTHTHTSMVRTITLFRNGTVDLSKINSWLATILWPDQDQDEKQLRWVLHEDNSTIMTKTAPNDDNAMKIFRMKGILSVYHSTSHYDTVDSEQIIHHLDDRRFIVQAVDDTWEVYPAGDALKFTMEEERCCKLIVIGRFLDEDELRKGFEDCFVG